MASTYSPKLRFELIGAGEQAATTVEELISAVSN